MSLRIFQFAVIHIVKGFGVVNKVKVDVFLELLFFWWSSRCWIIEIWKTQQWPQDWKTSVFTPIPKKGNARECPKYHTIALISHASKVMLKIFHEPWTSDVQAGFRKGRGTRDQIANIPWITEKTRDFQRNIYFCFMDYAKAFDCVDHSKLKNS